LDRWAGDFFLACAAGNGIHAAIGIVDRDYLTTAVARIRRLGASKAEIEDALQAARERLFVGPAPRIRTYSAAVPLKHWVRVVALRTAIDLHRSGAKDWKDISIVSEGELPQAADPIRAIMKRHFQASVEAAMTTELASLPARVRTVLRLHFVEGIAVDKLAARNGVHRVTVARWIWSATDSILKGVRRHLIERVGIGDHECDSVIRLLQSQLTLDLSRALAE
jgi:RNA polymerase sigma-70 factor (ECF subfamily)